MFTIMSIQSYIHIHQKYINNNPYTVVVKFTNSHQIFTHLD